MSPVGYHFVYVHVRLGTGSGLPDYKRELIVELTFKDLITNCNDKFHSFFRKYLQFGIHNRRRFLEYSHSPDHLFGHGCRFSNLEIGHGSLGLSSPVFVHRNLDRPHGILFNSCFHTPEFYVLVLGFCCVI